MLFRTLDNIRKKPRHVRQQYAFGGAVLFTAVVAGIWSLSLPARFAEVSAGVEGMQPASAPFSHIFGQLKEQFSGLGSGVDKEKGTTDDTLAEEPMVITTSSAVNDPVVGTSSTSSLPLRTIMITTTTASSTIAP